MSFVNVAIAGAGVVGALVSSRAQSRATDRAAQASSDSTALAVDEQRRQFDELQELFRPFIEGGTSTFGSQLDLIGNNGEEAQQAAIDSIRNGAEYQTMVREGENSMLQNASATGGLRGGNLQASMARFRPELLSNLINNQFDRLGGLSAMGQASAAGQAAAGTNSANQIAALYQQDGINQGNAAIARGRNTSNLIGGIVGTIGYVAGKKF